MVIKPTRWISKKNAVQQDYSTILDVGINKPEGSDTENNAKSGGPIHWEFRNTVGNHYWATFRTGTMTVADT